MPNPELPNILLVEDSDDDVFFFRHALKKSGVACTCYHVGDGGAAIQYLKSALGAAPNPAQPRPAMMFLDLKLPTFSGFEILAWLQQHKTGPDIPVTILSGSEHASDVTRATALGASSYLVKPISAQQLRVELGRLAVVAASAAADRAGLAATA